MNDQNNSDPASPDQLSTDQVPGSHGAATAASAGSSSAGATGPDQTERVILRTAQEDLDLGCPCDMIVVGDGTGQLTAAALAEVAEHPEARVWSWSASYAETRALAGRFVEEIVAGRLMVPAGPEPVTLEEFAAGSSAHVVLMHLPKALQTLDDYARRLAALARATGREDLVVVAGGRVKHMTRSQNDVLARSFAQVRASRGLGKSRALIATAARADAKPARAAESTTTIQVRGHERSIALRGIAGAFGGATADAGSLLLLGALDRALVAGTFWETADDDASGPTSERTAAKSAPALTDALAAPVAPAAARGATSRGATEAEAPILRALDLGSGNGLLTTYLAVVLPEAQVIGSDVDADAVISTRATLVANHLDQDRLEVTWDDSLSTRADRSVDLVLLNPPFHDGTAVDATLVDGMLDAAARVLRPGGQLWFVHNSHLRYRMEVERRVGPARQRSRDRRFTVLSATRI